MSGHTTEREGLQAAGAPSTTSGCSALRPGSFFRSTCISASFRRSQTAIAPPRARFSSQRTVRICVSGLSGQVGPSTSLL